MGEEDIREVIARGLDRRGYDEAVHFGHKDALKAARRQVLLGFADNVLAALREAGLVIVPAKPSKGLLVSMAMRHRHDYHMERVAGSISCGMTDREREVLLGDMRGLHEEVVGAGFYNPACEESYAKGYVSSPGEEEDRKAAREAAREESGGD